MARDKTDRTDETYRTYREYMACGTSFATMEVLYYGVNGDFEAVAKHLENGGVIEEGLRQFLVDVLRGRKRPANRTRTRDQVERERRIIMQIRVIQHHAAEKGPPLSDYEAMWKLLDLNPDLNEETVRNYVRKYRARHRGKKARTS